jgi:hypothetical protein
MAGAKKVEHDDTVLISKLMEERRDQSCMRV